MTFDQFAFYQVLYDIEHRLGYLKGNELAYNYLVEARNESTGTPDPTHEKTLVYLDEDYRFPCDMAEYKVQPYHSEFPFNVSVDSTGDYYKTQAKAQAWVRQVQAGADQAYANGVAWASGIASYAISICEQFVLPDAFAMDSDAQNLKGAVIDHLGVALPDWAGIEGLLGNWHGAARDSFDPFYRNTSGSLNMYAKFLTYAYAGTCAAVKIIDQTQTGVMLYAERFRSQVEEQLRAWVGQGRKPQSDISTPSWIADIAKVADDAFNLLSEFVPVLGDVAGGIDKGKSTQSGIAQLAADLGIEPPHDEPPFKAREAEEMYTSLTHTLTTKYYQQYVHAMDAKFSGSGHRDLGDSQLYSASNVLSLLHEQEKLYGWIPDPVSSGSLASGNDHYTS